MAARRAGADRTTRVQVLEVLVGGMRAGTLVHLGNEDVVFSFDPDYVDAPDRPTLGLSFKAADGGLLQRTRPTHVRLEPFFSNLLPEAHLREYLAARGGVHPDREFFLLWLLGADLPGALEVVAADGAPLLPPADPPDRVPGGRPAPLRFSLAGVQLKFSAVAESSGGLTLPASGVGGDWIVKLPSPRFARVPENEFAMMTLARAAGLDVPDVRLVDTASVSGLPAHLPEVFDTSLVVRRFDRPAPGQRVQIEDFAQVFGVYPERKYQRASYANVARVLWRESGDEAVLEFMRRLVFNVLVGNGDAHLKNWSLIYRDGRRASLAPAYDLISTVAYLPDDTLALSLGGTRAFADIDLPHLERFATEANLPAHLLMQAARETAARVRDLLPSHEPLRALPSVMRDRILAHAGRMRV